MIRSESILLFVVIATLFAFAFIASFGADDCRDHGGHLQSTTIGWWKCVGAK